MYNVYMYRYIIYIQYTYIYIYTNIGKTLYMQDFSHLGEWKRVPSAHLPKIWLSLPNYKNFPIEDPLPTPLPPPPPYQIFILPPLSNSFQAITQ